MTQSMINLNGSVVDASNVTVPASREFRDEWDLDGDAIVVDMTKAKEIHRARIRAARDEQFAEYDAIVTRLNAKALGGTTLTAADKTAVKDAEAARQALRDAPSDPAIDAATTPEELSAVIPAGISALDSLY